MEILMIGPGKPNPQNSGLGIACYHIAENLAKKVHLKLFAVQEAEEVVEQEYEQSEVAHINQQTLTNRKQINADLVHLSIKSKLNPYFYASGVEVEEHYNENIDLSIHEALEDFSQKVISKSRNLDFDVIYAHDWTAIPSSIKLHELFKKPFVLHVHALDYDRSGKKTNSWLFDLEKEGMQKADLVIAVSHYHKNVMVEEYGIAESKIKVIHHGLAPMNVSNYQTPFNEHIILFSGRLCVQKGADTFLKIAKVLAEKEENIRFIISGQGELMEELIAKANESNLLDKIHFTGHIPQEDLFSVMQSSDVMVMPSISEPFGLAALEATSLKVPIVTSTNCGVNEVLEYVQTAEENDIEAFVIAIRNVINHKNKFKKVAEKNAELVKSRNWEHVSNEILDSIKEVL
ncbi:glycosyltransferase family 4 protein [Marivirga arenosa]|uniref:Glycosyltransferase family 4 protein n=1 Tax=Marivirga arenosa TaxID=3059076 RepID=A0AA51N5C1_9BACT|nr:glycosyltransferase family 4 protein [Marivirga sp. ABR2-2]WMN06313.1 glycosyltransferase family 4 protein [Marivirga sp. ABR2-2]